MPFRRNRCTLLLTCKRELNIVKPKRNRNQGNYGSRDYRKTTKATEEMRDKNKLVLVYGTEAKNLKELRYVCHRELTSFRS